MDKYRANTSAGMRSSMSTASCRRGLSPVGCWRPACPWCGVHSHLCGAGMLHAPGEAWTLTYGVLACCTSLVWRALSPVGCWCVARPWCGVHAVGARPQYRSWGCCSHRPTRSGSTLHKHMTVTKQLTMQGSTLQTNTWQLLTAHNTKSISLGVQVN